MHFIIYGPEGSGKGTQAKLLSDKFNIPVITSGDLVRQKAKEKNGLGKICFTVLKEGRYVTDEIMFKLWEEKLASFVSRKGFIVDGFPRNVNQAKFLLDTLAKLKLSVNYFIYLNLPNEESRKRLLKRNRKLFEGSSISHDTVERINHRLKVYQALESPVLDFFNKKKLLIEIDARQSVTDVFRSILKKISNKP